ncbi:MAG: hypothetical protein ACPGWM_10380, partial [Flavobacteriales bacterium]
FGSNRCATNTPDEATTCFVNNGHSVWYTFEAPVSGRAEIISTWVSKFSNTFNIRHVVLQGTCGSFSVLACDNQNSGGQGENTVFYDLTPGEMYFVRFDAFSNQEGRFTIRVEEPELPVVPGVVYVDHEATGNNDGSSWENAFTDLQDGIALVGTNESIWIAEGTYHPSSTNDPSERFLIPDASNVHGGFAGNEFLLDQREYGNNKTVLSAEIGDPNDQTDNSTYLIALSNGNIGIALDRVTISDVGPSSDRVLEIYNDNALVTDVELVNNNDEGNTVIARGEDTRMINCLIHNCGNGGTGGIIYSGLESHTELINCTITNNSKANGVYKEANGTFLIFNSIIQGNTIWGSFTTSGVEVYNSLIQVSQDFVLVDCIVNEDAQFVDSNNNDYNLTSGSPAVGLGDNSNSTHPYDYI